MKLATNKATKAKKLEAKRKTTLYSQCIEYSDFFSFRMSTLVFFVRAPKVYGLRFNDFPYYSVNLYLCRAFRFFPLCRFV